jgi:hypothetical protein
VGLADCITIGVDVSTAEVVNGEFEEDGVTTLVITGEAVCALDINSGVLVGINLGVVVSIIVLFGVASEFTVLSEKIIEFLSSLLRISDILEVLISSMPISIPVFFCLVIYSIPSHRKTLIICFCPRFRS